MTSKYCFSLSLSIFNNDYTDDVIFYNIKIFNY